MRLKVMPCKGVLMNRSIRILASTVAMGVMSANAMAQAPQQGGAEKPGEKTAEKSGDKAEKAKEEKKPEEKFVQSKHMVRIGGQEIKYTATAGTILLKLEDGTPKASIFYVAYTQR